MSWPWIFALAIGTYVMRAVGPLTLRERELPQGFGPFVETLPAALLAALVATQAWGTEPGIPRTSRVLGVAAVAGLLATRQRTPLVVCLAVAAVVAAAIRTVGA